MLDEYVLGAVERISPEAPVPVVRMEQIDRRLGGAANVAANVASLGGKCLAVGAVGDDLAAEELRRVFRQWGLPVAGLVCVPGVPTIRKVRVMAQHQQLLRVDYEENRPDGLESEALIRTAIRCVRRHRAAVISDYGKGVISPGLITALLAECARRGARVVVDPKVGHFSLYRGVDVITPNHHEAGAASGCKITGPESLLAAGRQLLEISGAKSVLITRGPEGMSLFRPGRPPLHIPTEAREVYDVSGAGDTVVATMALALAAGTDLEEAARLANRAAGIVVGKLGTATVKAGELSESLRSSPLRSKVRHR